MKRLFSLLCMLIMLFHSVAALAEATVTDLPMVDKSAVKVTATGAVIQTADIKGKGYGEKMTEMTFENGDGEFVVTASLPKGKKLSYWVINGAKYVFTPMPTSIRFNHVNADVTVEAVARKADALTMPSVEQVQDERTGNPLLLTTINADFYFMKNATKGGGKALRSFDFTNDYVNTATKKDELGGRITCKVKAKIPGNKNVDYWMFNDMELYFSKRVTSFVVTELFESMTYEPIFAKATKYYNISCKNCTFSGGGYKNATSGTVKYGTKITVTSKYSTSYWTRNGSKWIKKDKGADVQVKQHSFTWVVKNNSSFVSEAVIK